MLQGTYFWGAYFWGFEPRYPRVPHNMAPSFEEVSVDFARLHFATRDYFQCSVTPFSLRSSPSARASTSRFGRLLRMPSLRVPSRRPCSSSTCRPSTPPRSSLPLRVWSFLSLHSRLPRCARAVWVYRRSDAPNRPGRAARAGAPAGIAGTQLGRQRPDTKMAAAYHPLSCP